jgi:hypothetical protein
MPLAEPSVFCSTADCNRLEQARGNS